MQHSDNDALINRLRRIAPWFAGHAGTLMLAVMAIIVAAMTEPAIPALMKPLIDSGFQQGSIDIWKIPLFLISLFALRGLSGFVANYCLSYISNSALLKIRSRLFAKLLNSDWALFARNTSSGLTGTIVYEVSSGASILVNGILSFAKDSLTLVALMIYLMFLNWQLTLIVFVIIPPIAWFVKLASRRIEYLTKSSQTAAENLAYVIEENVNGHRMIRLHNAQNSQKIRFEKINRSLRSLSLKSTIATSAITPLIQIFSAIALSMVIAIAMLQSGKGNDVTVGGFVSFITAMLMMVAPIKRISELIGTLTRGVTAVERGLSLLDEVEDERQGNYCAKSVKGEILFAGVGLEYPNGKFALKDVNLKIMPGQTIALVGASGSGKTSLVNLLPRFIHASAGTIFLDNTPLEQWSLQSLRNQFAFVSQDVTMLNDSIAANITLGAEYDENRLSQALLASDLSDFVKSLPNKEWTDVGHNASLFSGGQRQRLAIARAVYKDAPILILDEATSALDNTSEQIVKDALQSLSKGRTTIVVAHRLSTIEHADIIVVMEDGRIVETGTHRELLQAGGKYFQLYHSKIENQS